MASEPRHPLLVDTSSLIAVANTDQWDMLKDAIRLTTTNVCKHELRNHADSNQYPPEGSREQSLKQELAEHGESYQIVSLLDSAARRSIRRLADDRDLDIDVVGPPYLLYILLDTDLISKAEFCTATVEMIRTEGWTGYEVVKSAWASIPVDCAEVLDDALPPR